MEQRRGNRKELADLLHYARLLRENRQCYQEYCQQKTKGKREKFYAAHQEELAIYQMVKRELEKRLPDKKLHLDAWQAEYDALKAERPEKYEALKATRQDVRFVQAITNRVDAVRHKDKAIQHTPER